MLNLTFSGFSSIPRSFFLSLFAALVIVFGGIAVRGQTTEFVYQGQLQNASALATGTYDFEFLLFDSLSGGNQVGSTLTKNSLAVGNGIFSVNLDFGANFPGAPRFIEIHVRASGGGAFTPLLPRQAVSSAPYTVKSLSADTAANSTNAANAAQLGGIAASGYLQTNGDGSALTNLNATSIATGTLANARLGQIPTANIADASITDAKIVTVAAGKITGTIPVGAVPAGSGNYIQNGTAIQAVSNFNITGNGIAGAALSGNVINSATQYNIGGSRVFSIAGSNNVFAGIGTGLSNTGNNNAFFGNGAGGLNTSGLLNTFSGSGAGQSNNTGSFNSFLGADAGVSNMSGSANSFVGSHSGLANTSGFNNAFFGESAGANNVGGDNNTTIGSGTNLGGPNLSASTAVGARAFVTQSNSVVLGGISGINGAFNDTNVGIGTTAPAAKLHVSGQNTRFRLQSTSTNGFVATEYFTDVSQWHTGVGGSATVNGVANKFYIFDNIATQFRLVIDSSGKVGIGTTAPDQTLSVNGNASKAGGGSWLTFSDERLKNIKGRFTPGLKAVMRLQPLHYEYKNENALGLRPDGDHVGFSAQEVEKIIPDAVTKNAQGYRMINNDPIVLAMLNAIKEQQAEIETLKALVCRSHRRSAVCRPKK